MSIEFIPKMRGENKRSALYDQVRDIIAESIRVRKTAEIKAMSLEDMKANHLTAILPEIPKTKKGIDKAIEDFIKDMRPDKDNGEELLEFLGFYDDKIEEGDLNKRAKHLRDRIKFKVEAGDDITILSSTKEVIDVVREYLQSLSTEELYSLSVFGIVVTEEQTNKYIETHILQAISRFRLLYAAYEMYFYKYEKLDTIDIYSQTETSELYDKIKELKGKIEILETDYPKEMEALRRGVKMIYNNYSDSAILSTVKKMLRDGATTD